MPVFLTDLINETKTGTTILSQSAYAINRHEIVTQNPLASTLVPQSLIELD